jgi:5-methylcytosine-specific restriction protein A
MTSKEAGVPTKALGPCKDRTCSGRATERGYCATHAALHPVPKQVDNRPSASQRGYDAQWRRIRAQFLKYFPQCCQCAAKATEVDHIKPLASGGSNKWENLQPLCKPCHSRKTVRYDGGGWRRRSG